MRWSSVYRPVNSRHLYYLFVAVLTVWAGAAILWRSPFPSERPWLWLGGGIAYGLLAALVDYRWLRPRHRGVPPSAVQVFTLLFFIVYFSLRAAGYYHPTRDAGFACLGFGAALFVCYPLWLRRWKLVKEGLAQNTLIAPTEPAASSQPKPV